MYSTQEARKMLVFVPRKQGGAKRYGKVLRVVFHPTRKQAVGIIVKRPDALLMVKRKERFVAFDRLQRCERGFEVVDEPDSWDQKACKRLGIDYDLCILWDYQVCKTADGRELGTISDVVFDEETLKIDHIDVSRNSIDRAVLGAANIPAARIRGYDDGAIVVEEQRTEVAVEGGAAAAAGKAWAKASHAVSEKGSQAAAAAGDAINRGAYKLGEAIGSLKKSPEPQSVQATGERKQSDALGASPDRRTQQKSTADKAAVAVGRQLGRASRMFKDFKDEYDKASRD